MADTDTNGPTQTSERWKSFGQTHMQFHSLYPRPKQRPNKELILWRTLKPPGCEMWPFPIISTKLQFAFGNNYWRFKTCRNCLAQPNASCRLQTIFHMGVIGGNISRFSREHFGHREIRNVFKHCVCFQQNRKLKLISKQYIWVTLPRMVMTPVVGSYLNIFYYLNRNRVILTSLG